MPDPTWRQIVALAIITLGVLAAMALVCWALAIETAGGC